MLVDLQVVWVLLLMVVVMMLMSKRLLLKMIRVMVVGYR
jgi:hypothetical protein